MKVTLSPINVRLESGQGCLVFHEDELVAVLVRLSDYHEEDSGKWFMEFGLGEFARLRSPTFDDLGQAQTWMTEHLDVGVSQVVA